MLKMAIVMRRLVSVSSGYRCVNLRKWFQPLDSAGDIKPTKKGVSLRLDEWSSLCNLVDVINKTYTSLDSVFIAFNINHSSILPLMALNSLYCADVPLSNYSLTHSRLCSTLLLRRRSHEPARLAKLHRMPPVPRQLESVRCEQCSIDRHFAPL